MAKDRAVAKLDDKTKALTEAGVVDFFGNKDAAKDDVRNFDENDRIIPRLRLLQSKSPEVEAGELAAGLVVDNIVGLPYVANPEKEGKGDRLRFIPIDFWKDRKFYYGENDKEDGIRCQSKDFMVGFGDPGGDCASCKFSKWDNENNKKPPCMDRINVLMMCLSMEGAERFVIFSFKATSYKAGKTLLNTINGYVSEGDRIFTREFQLTTKIGTYGKRTVWECMLARNDANRIDRRMDASDAPILLEAAHFSELWSRGSINVSDDVDHTDETSEPAGAPSAADDSVPF